MMPFKTGTDRNKGYTLLEILISLAALFFGLLVVSEVMNASLRQADRTEEMTEIQLACQNTMNEILSGAMPVAATQTVPVTSFPNWIMTVTVSGNTVSGNTASGETLSGNTTADETASGEPVPAESVGVPVPGLVAVTITAQKYESVQKETGDGNLETTSVPIDGFSFVFKQWARLSMLKIAASQTDFANETHPFSFTPAWPENRDPFADAGLGSVTPGSPEGASRPENLQEPVSPAAPTAPSSFTRLPEE